jgi:hypothetical protein
MSRRKKGQECNADNSHACLNEIEGSFQTLLNAKNQRKENSIKAAPHPIIVVKNARVRARAEVRRHNAIPVVCVYGDRDCSCYPHCRPDPFNSRGGREMIEVFRSEVIRG